MKEKIEELLEEAAKKYADAYASQENNGKLATFYYGKVTAYKKCLDTLPDIEKMQREFEEREASVCPEDFGFEEYIKILKKEKDNLRSHATSYLKRGVKLEERIDKTKKLLKDNVIPIPDDILPGTVCMPSEKYNELLRILKEEKGDSNE